MFSPDGTKIVFIAKRQGQFDVAERDVSNGSLRWITGSEYDEWDPTFSPDGRRLVYAAREDGNWDLFMLDLVTTSVRRLTDTRGDEWDPAFTSDGSRVLYAGVFGVFRGIYRLQVPQ